MMNNNSAFTARIKYFTTFESAALFLRGRFLRGENACINYQRGSGRFAKCVILRNESVVWPTDFFHGACANCLGGSATKCSLSELALSYFYFEADTSPGSTYKERASRSSRPPSRPGTPSRQRRLGSIGSSSSNRVERSGFILPQDLNLDEADDLVELERRLDDLRFDVKKREVAARRSAPLSPIGDAVEVRAPFLGLVRRAGSEDKEEEDSDEIVNTVADFKIEEDSDHELERLLRASSEVPATEGTESNPPTPSRRGKVGRPIGPQTKRKAIEDLSESRAHVRHGKRAEKRA